MGGSKGGGEVERRRVDLDPGARAWVVGVGGGHVRVTGALGVHREPRLDGVDVAEGGGDCTLPGL